MSQDDERLRALFQAEEEVPIPDLEARRAKGWERLATNLAIDTPFNVTPDAPAPAPPSESALAGEATTAMGKWLSVLAGTAMGLVVGFGVGVEYGKRQASTASDVSRALPPAPEDTPVEASDDAPMVDRPIEAPPPTPEPIVAPPPTEERAPSTVRRRRPNGPSTMDRPDLAMERVESTGAEEEDSETPSLDQLREDLLIARARVALRRGLLQESLLAIANHERRFPNGQFVEERERLAITVLVRQRRCRLARRRAERFGQAFPSSFHREAIESALTSCAPRE